MILNNFSCKIKDCSICGSNEYLEEGAHVKDRYSGKISAALDIYKDEF